MKIIIETGECRNDSCGDWYQDEDTGNWHIVTVQMGWKSHLAVAIHELIEMALCEEAGVSDFEVTRFDEQYERERADGKHLSAAEPGDDSRAPYKEQHQAATFAERACVSALGLTWFEHEENVEAATH